MGGHTLGGAVGREVGIDQSSQQTIMMTRGWNETYRTSTKYLNNHVHLIVEDESYITVSLKVYVMFTLWSEINVPLDQ